MIAICCDKSIDHTAMQRIRIELNFLKCGQNFVNIPALYKIMKKIAIAIIILLAMPSNGFFFNFRERAVHFHINHETHVPPFLFWRWDGKDVVIEYRDVVKNNDSIVANVTGYIAIPPTLPNQDNH